MIGSESRLRGDALARLLNAECAIDERWAFGDYAAINQEGIEAKKRECRYDWGLRAMCVNIVTHGREGRCFGWITSNSIARLKVP